MNEALYAPLTWVRSDPNAVPITLEPGGHYVPNFTGQFLARGWSNARHLAVG